MTSPVTLVTERRYRPAMGRGWNPWRALRAREHLTLVVVRLPDGVCGVWSPGVIALDHRLDRRQRNATLAHELVHDERGIGSPAATAATMQREEAIVRRITAERLIPAAGLAELERRAELEPIELWEVAEYFDVPEEIVLDRGYPHRPSGDELLGGDDV